MNFTAIAIALILGWILRGHFLRSAAALRKPDVVVTNTKSLARVLIEGDSVPTITFIPQSKDHSSPPINLDAGAVDIFWSLEGLRKTAAQAEVQYAARFKVPPR